MGICSNCEWRVLNDGRKGHCYMFEKDESAECQIFKPVAKRNLSDSSRQLHNIVKRFSHVK